MAGKKIALIGGGGARTPLLIHGIAQAAEELGASRLALYDINSANAQLMAAVGREIVSAQGSSLAIETPATLDQVIEDSSFVLSSIRVGGMQARARDERIVIEQGLPGQETTGPGGLAMALRTIPVALEHARLVETLAPEAWYINFTNPAGLITQALQTHSSIRVIGICDTPSELFHRTAWALGLPFEEMEFAYLGLNHLGWLERVLYRGEDITNRLLTDDEALLKLYPVRLFEPEMIRTLGLIPSEYLFFYYGKNRAYQNQLTAGASRGEEILQMNGDLFGRMRHAVDEGHAAGAVAVYKDYLNQRNASYMRLEAEAASGLDEQHHDWNPFDAATGYHRIALDVMTALSGDDGKRVVVNIANGGAIQDLAPTDVVEVPAFIDRNGPEPLHMGALPQDVRGLVHSVKAYERLAIRAAVERSRDLARLALMTYPVVGEWDVACRVLDALIDADPEYLGYLRAGVAPV